MMNTLTNKPIRSTTQQQTELATSDRSYNRHVEKPTRLYFKFTALGWICMLVTIVMVYALIIGLWVSMYNLLAMAILAGTSVSSFAASEYNKQMHREYFDHSKRITTTEQHERAIVRPERGISIDGVDDAMIIRRKAKVLNGVTIKGSQLEALEDALNDGKRRMTRELGKFGTRQYPKVVKVFMSSGYLDQAYDITELGEQWIREL